jgi:hypothetical protein
MGMTIIYLQDIEGGVQVSAEILGSKGQSAELAHSIVQGMLLIDGVFYKQAKDITGEPLSALLQ